MFVHDCIKVHTATQLHLTFWVYDTKNVACNDSQSASILRRRSAVAAYEYLVCQIFQVRNNDLGFSSISQTHCSKQNEECSRTYCNSMHQR